VLPYGLNGSWFSMPFCVMANYYPLLRTHTIKPLIIFHRLGESLTLMPLDLKRTGQ
jgi:hypothetical protein